MDKFTEDILKILLDKFAIGFLILLVGYFITKAIEKYKGEQAILKEYETMRDKTALQHLQRQIEELYSPLLGLIQSLLIVREIRERKAPYESTDPNAGKARTYLVEKYILPINEKIATLLREKIYLLDTDALPESYKQFLEYESQYAILHNLWKDEKIRSIDYKAVGFPKAFELEVKETLQSLRERYTSYLKRLEETPPKKLKESRNIR